jgi:acylphosphatase
MIKSIAIKISGKVQGVYFRQSAKETADELGIKGFVRNEPDGSVYAEACGEENSLEKFIEWCRSGPERAAVTGINVSGIAPVIFSSFEIHRLP